MFDVVVLAEVWPFSSSLMLWWAAAGVVPVVIHFWNRQRSQLVSWGAMRYLLAAMQRHSRRIQLRQWLLLVVRTATLLILALALARPQVDAVNRSVHLVAVLDGSASMSARRLTSGGDVKTFRELAIDELDSRVRELPAGSVVTVVESPFREYQTPLYSGSTSISVTKEQT